MQQTVSLLQVRRVAETTLPTRCPRVVFENRVARSNRREEGDRGSSRRTAREVPPGLRACRALVGARTRRTRSSPARRREAPTRRAPPRGSSRRCLLSKLASADRSRSRFARCEKNTLTRNRFVRSPFFFTFPEPTPRAGAGDRQAAGHRRFAARGEPRPARAAGCPPRRADPERRAEDVFRARSASPGVGGGEGPLQLVQVAHGRAVPRVRRARAVPRFVSGHSQRQDRDQNPRGSRRSPHRGVPVQAAPAVVARDDSRVDRRRRAPRVQRRADAGAEPRPAVSGWAERARPAHRSPKVQRTDQVEPAFGALGRHRRRRRVGGAVLGGERRRGSARRRGRSAARAPRVRRLRPQPMDAGGRHRALQEVRREVLPPGRERRDQPPRARRARAPRRRGLRHRICRHRRGLHATPDLAQARAVGRMAQHARRRRALRALRAQSAGESRSGSRSGSASRGSGSRSSARTLGARRARPGSGTSARPRRGGWRRGAATSRRWR